MHTQILRFTTVMRMREFENNIVILKRNNNTEIIYKVNELQYTMRRWDMECSDDTEINGIVGERPK